ncbi:hypothetical protein Pan97_18030 [Bremerella volcania]|uniref:DUF6487 domain-containing protein n=1 Tax=Bremerella volcania TaxID=2527984 RepID=A0A518C6E2_9BACT|nr:PF20097 family protein [Bremerella volcania]QDU74787.1 hypothetical protein Pan97_18030 [Bremerella volcania]
MNNPFESPIDTEVREPECVCPGCGESMQAGTIRTAYIGWDDPTRPWYKKFLSFGKNLARPRFFQVMSKVPSFHCQACQLLIMDLDPRKR